MSLQKKILRENKLVGKVGEAEAQEHHGFVQFAFSVSDYFGFCLKRIALERKKRRGKLERHV